MNLAIAQKRKTPRSFAPKQKRRDPKNTQVLCILYYSRPELIRQRKESARGLMFVLILPTPTRPRRLSHICSSRRACGKIYECRQHGREKNRASSVGPSKTGPDTAQHTTHLPETLERVEGLRRRMRVPAFLLILGLSGAQRAKVATDEKSACGTQV